MMHRPKHKPIRVNDKFRTRAGILIVIETKPGGRVTLQTADGLRTLMTFTSQMREWERA